MRQVCKSLSSVTKMGGPGAAANGLQIAQLNMRMRCRTPQQTQHHQSGSASCRQSSAQVNLMTFMGMHQVMSGREQHPGDASMTDQEAQSSRQTTLKQMLHSRHICEPAVHKLRLHHLHVGRSSRRGTGSSGRSSSKCSSERRRKPPCSSKHNRKMLYPRLLPNSSSSRSKTACRDGEGPIASRPVAPQGWHLCPLHARYLLRIEVCQRGMCRPGTTEVHFPELTHSHAGPDGTKVVSAQELIDRMASDALLADTSVRAENLIILLVSIG